jgi:hypothetical protein
MPKFKSIRRASSYEDVRYVSVEEIKKMSPPAVANTCKLVTLRVGNKEFPVTAFETLQVHLQHFLQELLAICRKGGVRFEERRFNSVKDVLALKTKVVVNCLGVAAKHIFGDNNVRGLKGYLIEYKNETKIKGVIGFQINSEPIKLYCFDDKILVGLTKEEKDDMKVDYKVVEDL